MIFQRFCGLFNFLILLSSVPAHPIMGDVSDTTIAPLSSEMTTTVSSVRETDTTITSSPVMEESHATMNHVPTTLTTALLDSVTDKTLTPDVPSTTLTSINPTIIGMTTLSEPTILPTVAIVTENKMQATASTTPFTELTTITPIEQAATTTPVMQAATTTPVVQAATTTPVVQAVETNSIGLPDTVSADMTTVATMTLPAATTSMTITSLSQNINEMNKQPDNTIPMVEPTTNLSPLPSVLIEPTVTSTLGIEKPNFIEELMHSADADNVLSMSSNEETTRMASSTDSKVDTGDKQVVPLTAETEAPKSQETKNELDDKSGCNSLATSFMALSIAVLYVIV